MDLESKLAMDLTEAAQRVRSGRALAAEAQREFEYAQRLAAHDRAGDFSLLRAVRLLDADPTGNGWRTSLEAEVSAEVAKRYGIVPMPGRIYLDLHARDMTAAGVSGSNYLVGTSGRNMFLPSLQGASIAFRLGANRLDMGADNVALPIVNTAPPTMWLADEGAQISTSQPVVGSAAASPKSVAGLITFSHQLARQASPTVENILMAELGRAVAAELDRATFNGTGANGEPLGILNLNGTAAASGATIAWSAITDMIEDVTTAGAPMISPGFAATGAVREVLMNREITASSGVVFTQDARHLAGFPLEASKTGPAGAIVFCDWPLSVNVLVWGVLELLVNPFTGFRSGAVSIRALLHCDTLFAHPGAIAIRTSVS